jgi:hypothetical protein
MPLRPSRIERARQPACQTFSGCAKETGMTASAATKWQDWASFSLGLWLALSPWTFGYWDNEAATANAAFAGIILALASHFGLSADIAAEEWLNLALGLWLVAAPFALGFWSAALPAANSIAVGVAAALLALSAMSLDRELQKWWHKLAGR